MAPPARAGARRPATPVWTAAVSLAVSAAVGMALAVYASCRNGLPMQALTLSSSSSSPPPHTFCYNGITTMADDQFPSLASSARCFTVSDGRFVRVFTPGGGKDDGEAAPAASTTASEGYVIPGLWDGHGHLIPYGEFLLSVDLFASSTFGDVRQRLRDYVAAHPGAGGPDRWLRGFGWDQMALGSMPTAALMEDADLHGLFVMLDRVDAHCVWVSQAVLDLLPADVPDVPGGEVVRSPGLGVFCDNAMDLVLAHWPRPGRAAKTAYIREAMRQLRSLGLVGIHDAGVLPEDLKIYQKLVDEAQRRIGGGGGDGGGDSHNNKDIGNDAWTLRVYAMVECAVRNTFCPDDVAGLLPHAGVSESFLLSIRSVKLFADGALGSWGSALLEPYSDRPDTAGSLLVNASTLKQLTHDWAAAGYQVNIHAIGDLANRLAVDAFEAALVDLCEPPGQPLVECQVGSGAYVGKLDQARYQPQEQKQLGGVDTTSASHQGHQGHRFRIEHAQIVHPHDQARIHALALLPSVQPTHATSDMAYAERRLGSQRTRQEAYRMRSFLHRHDADHTSHPRFLNLGSDFPIEPPDPFQGIYAAVARRSPHSGKGASVGGGGQSSDDDGDSAGDNHSNSGWYPEEALSLADALAGFTRGPAYAAFWEGHAGVIQAGALADWVVLDRPIDEYDIEDLRRMRVKETWVGGKRVYARDSQDESTV